MVSKDYYVGLDMGTASVGWAVTDKNYKLLRAKGKDLWGIRLFSGAETSAERRRNRANRRGNARSAVRLAYVRELFADVINVIDPGFYQRLADSKYYIEDKNEEQPFALFNDSGFTDKEYYEKYPTVFHLRKELIESKDAHDVRLVYLAINELFKHRGHFLNANLDGNANIDLHELIDILTEQFDNYSETVLPHDFGLVLEEILPSKEYSNSKKVETVMTQCGINKAKQKNILEAIKLVCGNSGKLSVLFSNDSFDEEHVKYTISFRDGNFEEKILTAEEILSEDAYEILMTLKSIHDWGVLSNIMNGNGKRYEYLSFARVASYEKHHKDLQVLKSLYKKYAKKEYHKMFREMSDNTYSAYVGSVNYKNVKQRRGAKCDEEKFFKDIVKLVEKMPENDDTRYVLREIENGNFLPKQLIKSNGVIPNQVHKAELIAILNNAESYLPFLKETDETGLTVSQKLIQLFSFQIPYYVGPLYNDNSGNAWSVRKENGRVYPWNFEDKIDTKASAEKFIEKMVKHCTYLNGETVLPKCSLLYEKYMVLNELNNLKVNGVSISAEIKQGLYKELFRKGKKVRKNQVISYLKKHGYAENKSEVELSGFDDNDGMVTNTLSNYAKFTAALGVEVLSSSQEKMAEDIILWSTVYGDSKKFLKSKILEVYGDELSAEQLKRILGFKFKDWGRFSKEFLLLEGAEKDTGEIKTIISRMWDENFNLMELLSGRFTYLDAIKEKSNKLEKSLKDITYDDLEDLYISAPVKRMTWQTILILKELRRVLGADPKRIFVEMARDTNTKPERKDSRKKKFEALYKKCKDDGINWSEDIAKRDESSFRSKKLYLYYTQKGRCMYTNERIEIDDLFNDNLYDIDHIYPRHFVKDDSIENNLVLVKKQTNAHKSDNFPLEGDMQARMRGWWKSLAEGGFITEEKYKRLTRTTEFSDEERAAFINRQIVETRQGTKMIAELLQQTYPNTEIVYVKAGNVSTFRNKYDLIKCRVVNDFHHANDAYLNIVVGNTYFTKFTRNSLNFIKDYNKDKKNNNYHMYKIFDYNVQRNGETAWTADNNKSIGIVKKMMAKNSPLVTRMNYEESGGIADQTIYSASEASKVDGVGYIPVKATDEKLHNVCRYGGFKKYTGAYFFLVEHTLKGKRVRSFEAMPIYKKAELNSIDKMEAYCREELQYVDPSVRLEKIKMYSLLEVNGYRLYLTGRSNAQLLVSNAEEMILDYKSCKYIKSMVDTPQEELHFLKKGIAKEQNLALYDELAEKFNNKIFSRRPNSIGKKLIDCRETFAHLSVVKQVEVILQILQLSSQGNQGANLEAIELSKKTGTMKLNKVIADNSDFSIINQSVTGLFESRINLKTV